MDKSIFNIFIEHDTLLHPEVVDYFANQDNPEESVSEVVRNLDSFPLVLTLEHITSTAKPVVVKSTVEPKVPDVKLPAKIDNLHNTAKDKPEAKPGMETRIVKSEGKSRMKEIPGLQSDVSLSGAVLKAGDGSGGSISNIDLTPSSEIITAVSKPVAMPGAGRAGPGTGNGIKIISDITDKSTCEGDMKDFVRNINHRFKTLRNILRQQYRIFARSGTIDKINLAKKRDVFFVGMINKVGTTKKDNTILTVEDETGEINVFLKKDNFKGEKKFLNDEVIGITGETNSDLNMVMATRVVRPAPPKSRMINRTDEDIDVVFISDIHVGSCEFLERQWNSFVKWLGGKNGTQGKATSENVRYLVVAGDLVDGIGIYPDQQEELVIKDIYEQYRRLGELMADIPDDIKIILSPGNHDAVRQAEPQPALRPEFQKYFGKNAMFVGNPCYLSLHSVEVLVYHGRSFDDIVKFIPEATYLNPIQPMKEILLRRHLVPIYGERTPIAPEHTDMLLVDRLPDIFVTGHVHTAGCENYSNMLLMNASAWQAQTSYQRTLNFNPDPCKAYKVSLNTVRATELDFTARNF
jgi:DNA polymerase II small subunit